MCVCVYVCVCVCVCVYMCVYEVLTWADIYSYRHKDTSKFMLIHKNNKLRGDVL